MPDTSTEVAIATTTLGSAASEITFSSIAATYTDLRIVFVGTQGSATAYVYARVNGDTGNNYSETRLNGNGATVTTGRNTNESQWAIASGASLSTTLPALVTLDLFSYAGSTNKTALSRTSNDQNGSGFTENKVHLWRDTAAITSVTLRSAGGGSTFATGTTATLYGIL
jgi:hypothetical protein